MIIAAVDTLFTVSKAADLAARLNAEDPDWTYAVVKIDAKPEDDSRWIYAVMAKVSMTDEDGEFVGYL
tara:strand:- start:352 stop:555 length:204 start_codon:yes stop_codon:yes gene_type:complete